MRYLFCGDPHAMKDSLRDMSRLMSYVAGVSKQTQSIPVFLGDQHHHHGIIYAEVMDFYSEWFSSKAFYDDPIVVVGNHDQVLGTKIHTMTPYADRVRIIDRPQVFHGIVWAPYVEDIQSVVEFAQKHPECPTMVFHATVDGALYENGFPARDGVDPALFPQRDIISGHIHRPGMVGKVHYVGAPRWMTTSDANTDRAIWVMDFDTKGNLLSKQAYSTNDICRQILHFVDTEDNPVDPSKVNSKDQNIIDIHGTSAWVDSRSELFWSLGCRVRAFKHQQVFSQVRESEGVDVAFVKFCDRFIPEFGTPVATLREMVEKRLHG